jgi:hypothetical protein
MASHYRGAAASPAGNDAACAATSAAVLRPIPFIPGCDVYSVTCVGGTGREPPDRRRRAAVDLVQTGDIA